MFRWKMGYKGPNLTTLDSEITRGSCNQTETESTHLPRPAWCTLILPEDLSSRTRVDRKIDNIAQLSSEVSSSN